MSRTVEVNGAEIELTGIGQLRDFLSRVDGRTLVSITVEYTNGECHAGHGSEQCADKTGERTAEGGWSEETAERMENTGETIERTRNTGERAEGREADER